MKPPWRSGQGRSEICRPLGDGGSGRAIPKGVGPAGAVTRQPERQRRELEFWSALATVFNTVKASPRRKQSAPMRAHESCGSSWVPRRSAFTFPLGNLAVTRSAGNSM